MNKSSFHPGHVMACAAYLIGWQILMEVFLAFGVFDFLFPATGIEFGFTQMFVDARKAVLIACQGGGCAMASFAYHFVPLAIVWAWIVPKLFDGPVFAAAAHPRTSRFVHLVGCLALVPLCAYYVVGPLFGLFSDDSGLFDYGERWQYLPGVALAKHLGYFVAACLATRHSIRIRTWQNSTALFEAVRAGDAQAVLDQLADGADPNAVQDEDGATPLHVAVRSGWPDVVAALLANKADPHGRDHAGATALHRAAAAGDVDAINSLLDAGADPNAYEGDSGRTPLRYAEEHGRPEAIAALQSRTKEQAAASPGQRDI